MAETLDVAGTVDQALGRDASARARFARAIDVFEQSHGADFPRIAGVLEHLAALDRDGGRPEHALPSSSARCASTSGPMARPGRGWRPACASSRSRKRAWGSSIRRCNARSVRALRGPTKDDPIAAARDAEVLAGILMLRGAREPAAALLREAQSLYTASYGTAHALAQGVAQQLSGLAAASAAPGSPTPR